MTEENTKEMAHIVDELLQSEQKLGDLIGDLLDYKLHNFTDRHAQKLISGYFERGVLLKGRPWEGPVWIFIVAKPEIATTDEQRYRFSLETELGSKIEKRELVEVWRRGKWIRRGPWEKVIKEIIAKLVEKVEKEKRRMKEAKEMEAKRKEEEEKRLIETLYANWEKYVARLRK